MENPPMITADWLLERVKPVRGSVCLVWCGYMGHDGKTPKARPPGADRPYRVRVLVWAAMAGRWPGRNEFIRCSCDTPGCVAPECIYRQYRKDVLAGRTLPLDHRMRIALGQRALGRTDLTPEAAREIAAASTSIREEAALRGVGQTTVAQIRRGERWVNYGANPWLMLQQ